jgi:Leucine-rich repeat (LRR) protein
MHNKLSMLPPEIGQLTGLHTLDLSDNKLRMLPPEIGQLTNLEVLKLARNQLRVLPPEAGQLTNLRELNLDGNPLEEPLPGLIATGIQAVLAFLQSLTAPTHTTDSDTSPGRPDPDDIH